MISDPIDIPNPENEEAWEAFQKAMDDSHDAMNQEIRDLAKELDVNESLAGDIWYLRTRSRHSVETELRMVKCYRETGTDDFRCTAGEEEEELARLGY